MKTENFVFVKSQRLLRKIYTSEIDYIMQSNKKIKVVAESGEYEFYEKLANIEGVLGDSFIPVLKTVYVNLDRVSAMYDQCIEFQDGNLYYVGRMNFIAAKQNFCRYILQKQL